MEVEIESVMRNLKKCTGKVECFEVDVRLSPRIAFRAIAERRTLIRADGGILLEETQQKQEESIQLRKSIGKLKVEADEISKEENTLKSSRIKVDQQLQK